MIMGSLDEEADEITSVNQVKLYGTDESLYIGHKKAKIPWGEHHKNAQGYRELCEMNSDIERMATIGFLFEVSWSVCNYWLWKFTNDTVFSETELEQVGQLNNQHNYGISDEHGEETAKSIYKYITDDSEVQSNLIDGRNERLDKGETGIVTEVRRLRPERLVGEFTFKGVLFDRTKEEEFMQKSKDYGWLDDANKYIEDKFRELEETPYNAVVSSDGGGKPVVRSIEHVVSLDTRYSHELSKLIEVGPYREDVNISYHTDYEDNSLTVTVEKDG